MWSHSSGWFWSDIDNRIDNSIDIGSDNQRANVTDGMKTEEKEKSRRKIKQIVGEIRGLFFLINPDVKN